MKRKIHQLKPVFVHFIPERLEEGVIYISEKYQTALHKCCCGCGNEVVTPLRPSDWTLYVDLQKVSLYPSIGSWQLPCQSHYWIHKKHVIWAERMTTAEIELGREQHLKRLSAHIENVNRQKDNLQQPRFCCE